MRKNRKAVLSQRDMAFDNDWKPVDWFAKNAWVRIKMDLLLEEPSVQGGKHWRVHVVDLKTGRIYEDKLDQLDLYNLAALCLDESIITHAPTGELRRDVVPRPGGDPGEVTADR
jgi:hypothetical protein